MRLVDFAWRELQLAGTDRLDPALAAAVLALVGAAEAMQRSGHLLAAELADPVAVLLRRRPLSALTDDPGEWADRSGPTGRQLWQNRRDPQAFSHDGGRSYFLLPERALHSPGPPPTYPSTPAADRSAPPAT